MSTVNGLLKRLFLFIRVDQILKERRLKFDLQKGNIFKFSFRITFIWIVDDKRFFVSKMINPSSHSLGSHLFA